MLEDDCVKQAIARISVGPERIITATEAPLPAASAGFENLDQQERANAATNTPSASRALFHAYQVARSSGSTYIDPEHLFFALLWGRMPRPGRS